MARDQKVSMPLGAEILTVALQYGSPHVWFRCDDDEPLEGRAISCRGTGHDAVMGRYLGTVVVVSGQLVWHYFEGGV